MTNYDFTTILDRRHTNSWKWDVPEGALPMTTADMDFRVAPEIQTAMKEKIAAGAFGYEYPTDQYFQAVQTWYKEEHHVRPETEWMTFTTGIILALTATVNHLSQVGDKVLIMTPVYNIFFNSIINSGRQVNAYQMEYDQKTATYRVDWAEVEARMADPLTTMMILCNPHNPTGRVWTRGELEKIMTLANQYGVIVIADEIHGDLVMEGPDTRQPFYWGRS